MTTLMLTCIASDLETVRWYAIRDAALFFGPDVAINVNIGNVRPHTVAANGATLLFEADVAVREARPQETSATTSSKDSPE